MTDHRPHSWHEPPELSLLPTESYTAQRLQHATPEHLHLTSRRFFIGPIPEGWLKNHRRDWYKHHLHLNYSSRAATFSFDPRESRQRRLTGLDGPSSSALYSHSFPQPEDLSAEEEDQEQNRQTQDSNQTTVAKTETPLALPIPRGSDQKTEIVPGDDKTEYVDAESEPDEDEEDQGEADEANPDRRKRVRRTSTKSFVTASTSRSVLDDEDDSQDNEAAKNSEANRDTSVTEQASGLKIPTGHEERASKSAGKRPTSTVGSTNGAMSGLTIGAPSVEIASTSSLLRKANSHKAQSDTDTTPTSKLGVLKAQNSFQPTASTSKPAADPFDKRVSRTRSQLRNLVKFDIPEDSRRAELALKAKSAQMTIQRASTKLRRSKIKDGLVVKMERMLVRVDTAAKDVPPEFDENSNQKTDSHVQEKWREYMVVCRQHLSDNSDFVLQMYKTRVIPEIEKPKSKKRATYEIPLGRKVSKMNLYSNLDKSVVVWLPSSKGTKIFIMQARTASNAVEWYTFLRNVQGWRRASELQINIPDMSVSLRIDNPFEKLEMSQNIAQEAGDDDEEEAILNTMKEEQAVAQNLIKRCLHMLEDSPEWRDVLDSWINHQRMGLAWKRYDRLEWIHGSNERKMFGTIAMQKSHELELRPKCHYPTTTITKKKRKTLTEPSPVEGFLIRLTSQRGRAKRLGLMYHKQLYFQSHDQFLIFSRPPKVTPPPPPKLPASQNSRVPSAHEIVDKTPDNWTVDPYPLKDGEVEWLTAGHSGTQESRRLHDRDAEDEAERKARNLLNCDGYISLANIVKVRKAKLGEMAVDEHIESGSDVDFDAEVDDDPGDDGTTKEFNVDRTFELILKNGLIIRLQAADEARRKQWMKHLRALAKYWKHRTASDIALHKSTRSQNLTALNIDEEAEAYVGQFAQKWEVTQSYASPLLYNFCGIASCRSIHMSGILYRKPRIHAAFARCSVMLAAGSLLIFQDVLRSRTGQELAHIHHERIANLDLKDCYIYSGLLTESDLLYQNQTFDSNKPGHHALPRIYLNDGWTSTDEDVMTTFVIWHGKSKSWFRAEEGAGGGEKLVNQGKRTRLKRVAKLGSKGRSVVFRARSRAERDHWVLAIQNEIEKVQERGADFRIEETTGRS